MNYKAQYKDPRWQKKRLLVLEKSDFKCQLCNNDKETLNVHHGYYERHKKVWEYNIDTLWCLCESCHKKIELTMSDIRHDIGRIDPIGIVFLAVIIENICAIQHSSNKENI